MQCIRHDIQTDAFFACRLKVVSFLVHSSLCACNHRELWIFFLNSNLNQQDCPTIFEPFNDNLSCLRINQKWLSKSCCYTIIPESDHNLPLMTAMHTKRHDIQTTRKKFKWNEMRWIFFKSWIQINSRVFWSKKTNKKFELKKFMHVVWMSCRVVCIAWLSMLLSLTANCQKLGFFSTRVFLLIFLVKKNSWINPNSRFEKIHNSRWSTRAESAMHTIRHDFQTTCKNAYPSGCRVVSCA